jgi:ACT domain-containing protein
MAVSRSSRKQYKHNNKQTKDMLKHKGTAGIFSGAISMSHVYGDSLSVLKELETLELSIIKISRPISAATFQDTTVRKSDASQDTFESPTPTSLQDDLSHYKVRYIQSSSIGATTDHG